MFTLNVDGRTVEYSVLHAWDDGTVWVASQAEPSKTLADSDRIALAFSGAPGAWTAENQYGNPGEEWWNALGDMTAMQACKLRANNIRRMVKAAILPHYNSLYRWTYAVEIENTTDADSLIHLAEVVNSLSSKYDALAEELRAIAQIAGL